MPFRPRGSTPTGSTALGFTCLLACLSLFGCGDDYPIAPTACDDWCYATQRADCPEEASPDDCVSDCEETALGRQHPQCEPEWITLGECYRDAPDSAFTCVEEHSEASNTLCVAERRAANYCVSEQAGLCFDQCVRETEVCGGVLGHCEEECSLIAEATDGCNGERLELDRCLVQAPVACGAPGSSESSAQLYCCKPLVALLECAGYEGPGCEGFRAPGG
ncbi:MAG TPA: hypothetical protein VFU02_04940 [Polyangiaceae bacterium]|nr:hypothetical protein [Polyangiaceae bacterium]